MLKTTLLYPKFLVNAHIDFKTNAYQNFSKCYYINHITVLNFKQSLKFIFMYNLYITIPQILVVAHILLCLKFDCYVCVARQIALF